MDKTLKNSTHFVTRLENIRSAGNGLSISVFRGDLVTPSAIGNKQFKLAENLFKLKAKGCRRLLSFGGAWSNHLHALSVKAGELDIEVVGVVRGNQATGNRMLQSARHHGMRIESVSYAEYRQRSNPLWCEALCKKYQCDAWLPEGGSNLSAVKGCRKIVDRLQTLQNPPDVIALAVGTGATLAGIASGLIESQTVVGYPAVRDDQVPQNISRWLETLDCPSKRWRLADPLKPGYAKVNDELIEFILDFYQETEIALDPVYNGKAMMQLLSAEIVSGVQKDSHVVFVHTGGLMGAYGYMNAFDRFRKTKAVTQYFSTIEKLTSPSG